MLNIENENLIKKLYIENIENNNNSNVGNYILFGYNLLIRRAKLSFHWALDATYNYTYGYEQLLILMFLDKITDKMFPFIFVLMSKKDYNSYYSIFNFMCECINNNFEEENIYLESFCTDFEEAMYSSFKSVFGKKINNLHHIGCYFHYLQACRRHLQEYHLTKKIYQNIYSEYMEKFANFCFNV